MAKCAYDACQLPDNNNRFILQGVYILIGIFVLLSDSKNFTYFQTMLFIFPILIDIVCSGPTNRLAWVVRWVIGVADTLIMIVCFLGLGGIIVQDDASYFIIEASNPVPTPLLGHRCRSSQEITGSPTPFSTSNHYLWICASASFSLSNPNIAA